MNNRLIIWIICYQKVEWVYRMQYFFVCAFFQIKNWIWMLLIKLTNFKVRWIRIRSNFYYWIIIKLDLKNITIKIFMMKVYFSFAKFCNFILQTFVRKKNLYQWGNTITIRLICNLNLERLWMLSYVHILDK